MLCYPLGSMLWVATTSCLGLGATNLPSRGRGVESGRLWCLDPEGVRLGLLQQGAQAVEAGEEVVTERAALWCEVLRGVRELVSVAVTVDFGHCAPVRLCTSSTVVKLSADHLCLHTRPDSQACPRDRPT